MENINYSQLYTKLTKGLSPKTKDIFDRRFGIKTSGASKAGKGQTVSIETLESIGNGLGITRERVRQIEEAGFNFIKKNNKEVIDGICTQFTQYFESKGGFKKEEIVLQDLGSNKYKPYVLFFLSLCGNFSRVAGKKEYEYFWSTLESAEKTVKTNLDALVDGIQKHGKLMEKQELIANFASQFNAETLASYLEISKKIQENKDGKIGLISWPEIRPRGVKDKAYLVFKSHQKPLHFTQITSFIDDLGLNEGDKKTHAQTVHNELIKDARFVLVGRGTYALKEWGYVPGTIKDIIEKVLTEKPHLVSQEDIVKEVLSQRLVAKNTVMINLNNKKYFSKDATGKYLVRETA